MRFTAGRNNAILTATSTCNCRLRSSLGQSHVSRCACSSQDPKPCVRQVWAMHPSVLVTRALHPSVGIRWSAISIQEPDGVQWVI